jgi:uncharacterized protein (TIGR02246 family)
MARRAQTADELHEVFVEGINSGDLDGLMELYVPDCVGADLEGNTLTGSGPLREFLGGFLSVVREFSAEPRKTFVCGDVALTSLAWHAVVEVDGQRQEMTGASAEVSQRQPDGSWKYVIDEPIFMR